MSTAAIIGAILAAVQGGLSAAPQVLDLVEKAKAFIAAMFSAGLISKETQDATHAHLDSLQAMALQGIIPPHWAVQVDPQPVQLTSDSPPAPPRPPQLVSSPAGPFGAVSSVPQFDPKVTAAAESPAPPTVTTTTPA